MNPPAPEKNRRILIVDDNRSIQGDFQKILAPLRPDEQARGMAAALFGATTDQRRAIRFELDSAAQGQEAFAMVQRALTAGRPYAMAFMDVRMPPGWDGIETTARIWGIDPVDEFAGRASKLYVLGERGSLAVSRDAAGG